MSKSRKHYLSWCDEVFPFLSNVWSLQASVHGHSTALNITLCRITNSSEEVCQHLRVSASQGNTEVLTARNEENPIYSTSWQHFYWNWCWFTVFWNIQTKQECAENISHLDKLVKWIHGKLSRSNKVQWKVLHLGQGNPKYQYRLGEAGRRTRGTGGWKTTHDPAMCTCSWES